jgi:hypothetical protein
MAKGFSAAAIKHWEDGPFPGRIDPGRKIPTISTRCIMKPSAACLPLRANLYLRLVMSLGVKPAYKSLKGVKLMNPTCKRFTFARWKQAIW